MRVSFTFLLPHFVFLCCLSVDGQSAACGDGQSGGEWGTLVVPCSVPEHTDIPLVTRSSSLVHASDGELRSGKAGEVERIREGWELLCLQVSFRFCTAISQG